MQKKNVISIFVCMLLIAVSVSSVTGTIDKNKLSFNQNDDYNNLIKQVIENGVTSKNGWIEQEKLISSDGEEEDHFGNSVSIYGGYAIIGASWDSNSNGVHTGSVYIFRNLGSSWDEEDKLIASDVQDYNNFGISVSIYSDYAVIGADRNDNVNGDYAGSAYVFKRDGTAWAEQAKLLASDGLYLSQFGFAVSIFENYILIGAPNHDLGKGAVYIFKRNGIIWEEEAILSASDGETSDNFGNSVSIHGDYVVIGASSDDDEKGSAYVFKRDGTIWTEQVKLNSSDGAANDYFSASVSIHGDYVLIGTPRLEEPGSTYVFKRDGTTWMEEDELIAPGEPEYDNFGQTISFDGDQAIIGTVANSDFLTSVYIFNFDGAGWTDVAELFASDGTIEDYFGCSVSIDGDYALVGADGDDDNGYWSGSAYVFTKALLGPDLDCSSSLSWTDVTPGETVTGFITVENIGDNQSLLDWEVDEYPDWGTWTFLPESGYDLTPEDGEVAIGVTVIVPDEPETDFTGHITIINSEDPGDYCIVDVSLSTPVGQVQGNQQIVSRFLQIIIERYPLLGQILGL